MLTTSYWDPGPYSEHVGKLWRTKAFTISSNMTDAEAGHLMRMWVRNAPKKHRDAIRTLAANIFKNQGLRRREYFMPNNVDWADEWIEGNYGPTYLWKVDHGQTLKFDDQIIHHGGFYSPVENPGVYHPSMASGESILAHISSKTENPAIHHRYVDLLKASPNKDDAIRGTLGNGIIFAQNVEIFAHELGHSVWAARLTAASHQAFDELYRMAVGANAQRLLQAYNRAPNLPVRSQKHIHKVYEDMMLTAMGSSTATGALTSQGNHVRKYFVSNLEFTEAMQKAGEMFQLAGIPVQRTQRWYALGDPEELFSDFFSQITLLTKETALSLDPELMKLYTRFHQEHILGENTTQAMVSTFGVPVRKVPTQPYLAESVNPLGWWVQNRAGKDIFVKYQDDPLGFLRGTKEDWETMLSSLRGREGVGSIIKGSYLPPTNPNWAGVDPSEILGANARGGIGSDQLDSFLHKILKGEFGTLRPEERLRVLQTLHYDLGGIPKQHMPTVLSMRDTPLAAGDVFGAPIGKLTPGGTLHAQGARVGDIIYKVDDISIKDFSDLQRTLAELKKKGTYQIPILIKRFDPALNVWREKQFWISRVLDPAGKPSTTSIYVKRKTWKSGEDAPDTWFEEKYGPRQRATLPATDPAFMPQPSFEMRRRMLLREETPVWFSSRGESEKFKNFWQGKERNLENLAYQQKEEFDALLGKNAAFAETVSKYKSVGIYELKIVRAINARGQQGWAVVPENWSEPLVWKREGRRWRVSGEAKQWQVVDPDEFKKD